MTYEDIAHRIEVVANRLFDDANAGTAPLHSSVAFVNARVLWGIADDLIALSSRTPENVEEPLGCIWCKGRTLPTANEPCVIVKNDGTALLWDGAGDFSDITLPPAAVPGMWLVRLAVHS